MSTEIGNPSRLEQLRLATIQSFANDADPSKQAERTLQQAPELRAKYDSIITGLGYARGTDGSLVEVVPVDTPTKQQNI